MKIKGYFKRNREVQIAEKIAAIQRLEAKNLHITIYFKNQVLFQIMPSKHFIQYGLLIDKPDSFSILHFFNINKSLTIDKIDKFYNTNLGQEYLFFEDPKNNYNFVKEIGNDPLIIQEKIYDCIRDIYDLKTTDIITIDFAEY